MPHPRSHFLPGLDISERRIAVDRTSRRIALRVASFNDVHAGSQGHAKVRMPRNVNLDAAHHGYAELDDGTTIGVSTLPMGTVETPIGHAPQGVSMQAAAEWYDNAAAAVARVRYSMDEEGIRADGVLYDDVSDSTIDKLTASAPSGDWRTLSSIRKPTDFEHAPADFIGSVIVNQPGFSSTYSQGAAQPLRLAASAHSLIDYEDGVIAPEENTMTELTPLEAVQAAVADLNAQVATLTASSAPAEPTPAELAARLTAVEKLLPGIIDHLG